MTMSSAESPGRMLHTWAPDTTGMNALTASTVDHREHGVEVHVVAGARQHDAEDDLDGVGVEQLPGEQRDGLRCRAFAHADQDEVVAERLHVAALEGRRGPSPRRRRRTRRSARRRSTNIGWNR